MAGNTLYMDDEIKPGMSRNERGAKLELRRIRAERARERERYFRAGSLQEAEVLEIHQRGMRIAIARENSLTGKCMAVSQAVRTEP